MKKSCGSNGDGSGKCQYNAMRISELRKRAHGKGLNVDGSREMLIAALNNAVVQELESKVDSEVASEE